MKTRGVGDWGASNKRKKFGKKGTGTAYLII